MSLAPLAIGVVLVFVTGMWIFLLFTAASALVALAALIDATRLRRRFRRAVSAAGTRWSRRRAEALCSPGRRVRLLRARSRPGNPVASVHGRGAAVVAVGEALMDAELECAADERTSETLRHCPVRSTASISLAAGELTTVRGAHHEELCSLRWILVQLAQSFASDPPQVLVLGAGGQDHVPSGRHGGGFVNLVELRDSLTVHGTTRAGLAESLDSASMDPGSLAPVLISTMPVPRDLTAAACAAGWHVITVNPPDEPVSALIHSAGRSQSSGWELDLRRRELRRIETGVSRVLASDLRPGGLSRRTLEEHLRLGLLAQRRSQARTGLPRAFTRPLPSPLVSLGAHESLWTLIGAGPQTEETLDIVEDGPHILLAGTSGSGKSELLKSMILGWAARYAPEELNFILFDFKGGSTFHRVAELEHSLGLVTDLSQAQAERTLEAIRSELSRRERLFLDAAASDYPDYRAHRPDDPLARILVIIDEFRIFAHELPDAMDELMRLATLGRSLGLHLVLSTQRPQGVVTADIRANIGTIISLRLRSEEESRELVGTTEAAHVPRGLPGRGVIRRPGEEPVPFQGVQLQDTSAELAIRPEGDRSGPPGVSRETTPALVQALQRHLIIHGRRRTHTPLCPPLPLVLPARLEHQEVVLGLVDEPAHQVQHPLHLDVHEGQATALLGEPESGGTDALRALTRQLLLHPQEVHVYLLDGDHSLAEFRSHPRVGSWLTDENLDEVLHLLLRVQQAVQRRRATGASEDIPLVIVISAHARWHAVGQLSGAEGLEHRLSTVLGEGAGHGVSLVVSGGRELATGRLGSRISRKVYLPYGVPEDTQYLWPKLRATDPLPGRGVLLEAKEGSPGRTVQLVSDVERPRSRRATGAPALVPDSEMIRVFSLPASLPMPAPASSAVILGLTQFAHAPAVLDVDGWQLGLILGSAGTGKTNALRVLAAQTRCLLFENLRTERQPHSPAVETSEILLIDDADRLSPEEHGRVESWLGAGGRAIATARPSLNIYTRLPWSYRARGGSANFLLSPTTRSQGEVFGGQTPVFTTTTPGRAVWIRPEGTQVIQWWLH
ncbi:FtsK/SpoIIIE domain-containing protein [Nesterenkonia lutea]